MVSKMAWNIVVLTTTSTIYFSNRQNKLVNHTVGLQPTTNKNGRFSLKASFRATVTESAVNTIIKSKLNEGGKFCVILCASELCCFVACGVEL